MSNSKVSRVALALLLLFVVYPVAAETPPSLTPEQVGNQMVFSDPTYPYTISFAPSLHFNANPELVQAVQDYSKSELNMEVASNVALRFFLSIHPMGTPNNPNLNCAVEKLPAQASNITTEQYLEMSRQNLVKMLKADIKGPSVPVQVNGKTFYRVDYQMTEPRSGTKLDVETYIYLDEANGLGYNFAVGGAAGTSEQQLEPLRKAFKTVKIN